MPDDKRTRIQIKAEYGTPAFQAEYQAALAGQRTSAPSPKISVGSLLWLITRYRDSMAWMSLSVATRKQRVAIFLRVIESAGSQPYDQITKHVIIAGVDRRRETPAAALNFVKAMRGMFVWAVDAGLVKADPTTGVTIKIKRTEGHHTWTDDEVTRFEQRWPLGTRERVALDVLLYTGLRRGDAVRLGRQHVKNGVISIRTEKGGELVVIPTLQPLITSIAAGPCGDLSFIAGERGNPMAKESFGTWFRLACKEARVPGRAHGLRKAGATRAAENGATAWELDAIFGWQGGKMAELYTRKANRGRLAQSGAIKLLKNEL